MMVLSDIIILFVPFVTFAISVFFNRNKTPIDTIFSILTGYIFATEIAGTLIGTYLHFANFFIYNFYCLFFPLLSFRLFYIIIKSKRIRKRIKFLAFILSLIFIIDNFLNRDLFTVQQYHTYLVSLVFLIYIIYAHLLQLMASDTVQYFSRSKSFWISLGLLLFSVPFLPVMITFKFMTINFEIRMIVTCILILVMHTCFIIASLGTKYK